MKTYICNKPSDKHCIHDIGCNDCVLNPNEEHDNYCLYMGEVIDLIGPPVFNINEYCLLSDNDKRKYFQRG